MLDKNKWKTFPCKECLIKGKCKETCFEWPLTNEVMLYIKENNLQYICLCCGYEIMLSDYNMCPICHSNKNSWFYEFMDSLRV